MANVSSSNGLEKRPKLRFPGFDEPWKAALLSDYFAKNIKKNADGTITNVICNSAKQGLIPQRDYFDKDIANSDNTDGYYIIETNDFVYNPRKSNDAPYGPIRSYKYPEAGIVSPLYLCFRAKQEINPLYFEWYFRSSTWHRYIYMSGDSGARHDRVSIKDDTFFAMPINIPSAKEQDRIASFLNAIEQRIDKQHSLVEALKKYKRGAVSKLLNGTLAFNGFSDMESWQLKRVGDFCEVQMCKRVFKEQTTPDGDVPFYKIGTIGGLPDAYISRSLYEEYKMKYSFPRKGEFLISCAGTVGKCVPYNGEDSYYQDSNIVWLRNNSQDVSNEYLYLLISNVDWGTLNSTTITRIYNDNLRELSFHIPSLQMQKRIAEYIFALSKRIDSEQAMFEKLQQEKLGLLQQLFI